MEPILILKEISFRYEDSWILKDLDLQIDEAMFQQLGAVAAGVR